MFYKLSSQKQFHIMLVHFVICSTTTKAKGDQMYKLTPRKSVGRYDTIVEFYVDSKAEYSLI